MENKRFTVKYILCNKGPNLFQSYWASSKWEAERRFWREMKGYPDQYQIGVLDVWEEDRQGGVK